ncbi:hypothetical protein [Fodinicola feengrottensis]|uniref:hypothetical protein n=1 Tax=Fodinicola feengrottensis TaxID=435914 RepID=UPI002442B9AD|nr:hypothetical protein [Fodinicola feengrottensis]
MLAWNTPAVYDDAYDGSTMADPSGSGFTIQISGTYRIRARMSWAYLAAASSGFRYLGIYQAFGTFITGGSSIGSAITGIYGDPQAMVWDFCRWNNGAPCTAYVDFTTPLIAGTTLQTGIAQNSSNTLTYLFGTPYIWFAIKKVS